jgi:hypothetical protein
MTPDVDLVVNSYERTYRDVLAPGTFPAIVADNAFAFARRTATISNVGDREDAARRAQALVEAGEIDAFFFVDDHADAAIERTRFPRRDLRRTANFNRAPLVAVTLDGPEWLVYWDAEVRLAEPHDWITPAIELMEADRRILVANPAWTDPDWAVPRLEPSTIEWRGDVSLGRGFSDQVFLARRAELAAPIYGERCLARHRYPMAHQEVIFEAHVDSYMRHHDRLRATLTEARYVHPAEGFGTAYPSSGPLDRLSALRSRAIMAFVERSPWVPRCCRYV